jgi:hypothetical protein
MIIRFHCQLRRRRRRRHHHQMMIIHFAVVVVVDDSASALSPLVVTFIRQLRKDNPIGDMFPMTARRTGTATLGDLTYR